MEEMQDPCSASRRVWVGIPRAVLALGGFCPAGLAARRGISASFGLTFLAGEVRGWDAGGSQEPAGSHNWPAAGFLRC